MRKIAQQIKFVKDLIDKVTSHFRRTLSDVRFNVF